MADKKKTSRKPQPESAGIKPDKPKEAEKNTDENTASEKPFDFGGIPGRNLKKNLGCG